MIPRLRRTSPFTPQNSRTGPLRPAAAAFLAALAFAAAGAGPAGGARVRVENPDFHQGLRHWEGHGTYRATPAGLRIDSGYVFQKIPLPGGRKYRISMQIRAQDTPSGAVFVQGSWRGRCDEGWFGPASVFYPDRREAALVVTGGSFQWRRFAVVVRAPAGADALVLYLRKLPGTRGYCLYSRVRIRPTKAPLTRPRPPRLALPPGTIRLADSASRRALRLHAAYGRRITLLLPKTLRAETPAPVYLVASAPARRGGRNSLGFRLEFGARPVTLTPLHGGWCGMLVPQQPGAVRLRVVPAGPAPPESQRRMEIPVTVLRAKKTFMPAAPADLVAGGHSRYAVFIGAAPHPAELYAARELIRFVERSTGVRLPLASDNRPAPGPLVVIGRQNTLTDRLCPGIPYARLGWDGFVLRRSGPNLVITGAHPRGTLYGVYRFLRDALGCRWYADDTEVVPRRDRAPLPDRDLLAIPRFRYREVFCPEGGADGDFAARVMLNGQLGHRTVKRPLQPKHGGGFLCLFGYDNGARPAATAEARRRAIDAVRLLLEQLPRDEPVYVKINHVDGGYYAASGEDGRLIRAGGSAAAPIMDLACRVADAVRRDAPAAIVLGQAYLYSRHPCTNIHFPDNAGVSFAPIEANWAKPFDAPENQGILADLDGWRRVTRHVWCWLYTTDFNGYLVPLPNIDPMIQDIKLLARRPEVEGVMLQDSYQTRGGHFAALKAWVFARLLWNPELDGRALVREFMHGYYGPAAPQMLEYYDALHQAVKRRPCQVLTKTAVNAAYLDAQFLSRADALFRAAETAAAGNARALRHVRMTRMGVDYVILWNRAELHAQARRAHLDWPEDPERYARFAAAVREFKVQAFGEGTGGVRDTLAALRVPRHPPRIPDVCRNLPRHDWVEAQDLGFQLAGAAIVADPAASDGGAARMPGNTGVWGIQYPFQMLLPESGAWEVYAEVRIDPAPGASPDAPALGLGVDPGFGDRSRLELKLRQLADGAYHLVRLPGGPYRYDAKNTFWAAPPNSHAVKFIYVDRLVAVRRH